MENSELYNNSDLYWSISSNDSSGEGDFQTVSDSSEEVSFISGDSEEEEVTEEVSENEEELQSESESESQVSYIVIDNSDTISHIDSTLNSFLGLFVATLVVIGIGLIIRFIWKLLNK